MKAIDKLKEITGCLKGHGIETPEKEAEILLKHTLGTDTVGIYRDNPELSQEQLDSLERILNRRLRHEPLQYILGYEEFLGLKILVGPGVLIPRPETEFMAEQAIKRLTVNGSRLTVLDLCTGSGCLALALARAFPDADVYGIDISEIAIEYAKKNAEINGIKNVTFLRGNLFEPIEKRFTVHGLRRAQSSRSRFTADLIISNPPYIRTDDIKTLQPEIKYWEPLSALDGGVDGLDFYRKLIPVATQFLKDDGLIILELGYDQPSTVADVFKSSGYTEVEIIKDYAGIKRVIKANWRR